MQAIEVAHDQIAPIRVAMDVDTILPIPLQTS